MSRAPQTLYSIKSTGSGFLGAMSTWIDNKMIARTLVSSVYKVNQEWMETVLRNSYRTSYTGTDDDYVAVKIFEDIDEYRARDIQNEFEMLSNLKKECSTLAVVCLIGFIKETFSDSNKRNGFIVMEYVRGEPLSSLVITDPWIMANAIYEIADAVDNLHARGIIHNDIKPANIVMDERTFRPKLVDFGFSCISQKCVQDMKYGWRGTFLYMWSKKLLDYIYHAGNQELEELFSDADKAIKTRDALRENVNPEKLEKWTIEEFMLSDSWAVALTIEHILFTRNHTNLWKVYDDKDNKMIFAKLLSLVHGGYTKTFGAYDLRNVDIQLVQFFDEYILKRILDQPRNHALWAGLYGIAFRAKTLRDTYYTKPKYVPVPEPPSKSRKMEQTLYVPPKFEKDPPVRALDLFDEPIEEIITEESYIVPPSTGSLDVEDPNLEILLSLEELDPEAFFQFQTRHVARIGTPHNPAFALSICAARGRKEFCIWNRRADARHCACAFPSFKAAVRLFDDPKYLRARTFRPDESGVCPLCGK